MKDLTPLEHVFCSFPAVVLRKALDDHLAARQWRLEWDHIMQDLDRLEEMTVRVDGKTYLVRTDPRGTVGKVFQACGVALPPGIRPSDPGVATASAGLGRPLYFRRVCKSLSGRNLLTTTVEDGLKELKRLFLLEE